jgi:hypothetical protein
VVAFSNKSGFITSNRAVGLPFDFINPLTPNNILIGWRRNKGPSLLPLKSSVLVTHSRFPLKIFGSNTEGCRLCIKKVECFCVEKEFTFGNPRFSTSLHGMMVKG